MTTTKSLILAHGKVMNSTLVSFNDPIQSIIWLPCPQTFEWILVMKVTLDSTLVETTQLLSDP
jgi:hypothetical protein